MKNTKNMKKKYTKYITFILVITVLFLINIYASNQIKSAIFSVSNLIKDLILFILPFAIFFCILSAILKLGSNAILLMVVLFVGIFVSNFTMSLLAYIPSVFIVKNFINQSSLNINLSSSSTLNTLFDFNIKNPITPIMSLAIAFVVAFCILLFYKNKIGKIETICQKSQNFGKMLLNKVIIPLVPFFIFGFIIKIIHEQLFFMVIKMLPIIIGVWVVSSISYSLLLYKIFTRGNLLLIVKNIIPSFIIGMITMSSNVAMPSLLNGIHKTLKKETDVTNAVTPPTLNFHFVGDAFLIPILSMYIYTLFNDSSIIIFSDYIWLAFILAMIRFSNVAIPGGGAIIASPYLHSAPLFFNDEMSTLVITIYIVVDFLNTALNLFGNGAFIIGMNKIYYNFIDKKSKNKRNMKIAS